MKPEQLDKIIHERVRLAVMSALAARGTQSFGELKEILGVSDGNLSVHTRVLEEHGLITVRKEFVGRKPCTSFTLTRKGRAAFRRYVEALERILKPEG